MTLPFPWTRINKRLFFLLLPSAASLARFNRKLPSPFIWFAPPSNTNSLPSWSRTVSSFSSPAPACSARLTLGSPAASSPPSSPAAVEDAASAAGVFSSGLEVENVVGVEVEDWPNENPDDPAGGAAAVDADAEDPKENVGAEVEALGEPLEGTAAPNEKAVEGEVEGGFAPKEKPENGLAGVELELASALGSAEDEGVLLAGVPKLNPLVVDDAFPSSLFSDDGAEEPKLNDAVAAGLSEPLAFAVEFEEEEDPKLNGLADLALASVLVVSPGAGELEAPNENGAGDPEPSVGFSLNLPFAEADSAGLPNVKGENDDPLEAETVGMKPLPLEGADDDPAVGGLRDPKKPDVGTDGGFGIDGPAALPFAAADVWPGFQPVCVAISSINLAT